MSQLNTKLNDSRADQLYYDLTINNFQSTSVPPQPFYYNETRTIPFIYNPEEYYLSIIRFTMDSGLAPIFIPSIQPNSEDANLTIYSVSMTFNDYSQPTGTEAYTQYVFQKYVMWENQDESAKVPLPPSEMFNGLQDNSTGYYYCYSYSWWCYLVYKAYQDCLVGLQLAITAGGGLNPTAPYAPIINWDSTANSAIMYADSSIYDLNIALPSTPVIELYMNAPLYSIFGSFPAKYLGYSQLNGLNYRLLIVDIGGTNSAKILVPNTNPLLSYFSIQLFQEYSTTSAWTPITAIVFTSNTLPIQSNQVSTPLVYNNNQILDYAGNNSATANIITDIVSESGLYAPNLVYNPSAQYRLISMTGNAPLQNLDLNIFYRLKNGSLSPFFLQSGGAVSMKIAFFKKSTYKGK